MNKSYFYLSRQWCQFMDRCQFRLRRLHSDQSGSISISTVFAFIFLTMVLGMVMNIGRHADRKIKLQNGADAATYTGATVMARSMNTLAFTNHLMCDVFALTAYLREARDQSSASLTPEILAGWTTMAEEFADAPHQKFIDLSRGIPAKTPLETDMIAEFTLQNAAVSEQLLPVMEQILEFEMIPEFQRALVIATPSLANEAASEIASRHGPVDRGLSSDEDRFGESPMVAAMWQTNGELFGTLRESGESQLPVADPIFDTTRHQQAYFAKAVRERSSAANRYLSILNQSMLRDFDNYTKMSQFSNLWRGFTQAQLRQLLTVEYPSRNLPYQIRRFDESQSHSWIEQDYMFVGVTYWKPMVERLPGLFSNPINGDPMAFAQSRIFIPRRRLLLDTYQPPEDQIFSVGGPTHRDLMNQNWTAQLAPATAPTIPTILQSTPNISNVELPNISGLSASEFRRLNTH
ncbi:MAG: hypothetical protein ACI87E_002933 [Mariniblastus sp.]|jgi:hypothetical protein